MKTPNTSPKMEPRQFKGSSVWYVLVTWGDQPLEQVGGFPTEDEAKQWIAQNAKGWLKERLERPFFE
jgi:hypothetical protein